MAEANIPMTMTMDGIEVKVLVSRFHPKDETPKSYGDSIALMTRPHGDYESGLVKVYKLKDGTYRASTYVDGCFHAQYGKLKFEDDTFERIMNARDEYLKLRKEKGGTALKKEVYAKYNLI